ncbi:MAG: metal-dependent hydrolase [Sphingomicrobium sp.]
MPMTTTHALLPVAAAVAFADRPVPWRLIFVAAFASAAPDIDGLFKHFLGILPTSVYGHRGASHSLFAALAAGVAAAAAHRWLGVRPLVAGVCVALAAGSHGILDMMTDSGDPVAYLWPVSSVRLFADWRPIHSGPVEMAHLFQQLFARLVIDLGQLILPAFVLAFMVRAVRNLAGHERVKVG